MSARFDRLFVRGRRTTARAAVLLLLTTVALIVPSARPSRAGTVVNLGAPGTVAGRFLVELTDTVSDVPTTAANLVATYGGSVNGVYQTVLHGFSLSATNQQATQLAGDALVRSVEADQRLVDQDTQANPPWHLDRDDQVPAALDGKYNYGLASVPVYVVDSGVRATHEEFKTNGQSRVTAVFNAFPSRPNTDCKVTGPDGKQIGGHGTMVAGVVGSNTYGVAKNAPIRSVKVRDCVGDARHGTGDLDAIIEGLDYVATNGTKPAVVNLSLAIEGRHSFDLDTAVRRVLAKGFAVVTGAGNGENDNGIDACADRPSTPGQPVSGLIVVSAVEPTVTGRNPRPSWANYGPCVTLFAPGTEIETTTTTSDTSRTGRRPVDESLVRGTSFAAPQVAGAASMLLTAHPTWTPGQVEAALVSDATPNAVADPSTPASLLRLLHVPPPDQPGLPSSSDLNVLFNAYGDLGGHWTGGDETMSVQLSGQRVAWFFGDTMLGTVNADGSRPPNQPMIHNSVVIQDGNTLTQTLHGGTAAEPKSYVGANTDTDTDDLGWWPGESRVLDANHLQVFYTHVGRGDGGGALAYKTKGRAIANFALPSLTLVGDPTPVNLATNAEINWGAAMVDGGDGDPYTYIYGMKRVGEINSLYVARAPKGGLANVSDWRFWTGDSLVNNQWSTADAAAVPVMTGVGAGFSVKYLAKYERYVLVTMDLSEPFSNRVLAFFAGAPTGPFTHQTLLYNAPETATHNVWVYNARIHPEQSLIPGPQNDDTFVVSYNVGSFTQGATDADVHLGRPRFFKVRVVPPADPSLLPAAPTGLAAATVAPDTVRLTWTPPAGTGLKYWVYQRNRLDNTSQFTRAQSAVTVPSADIRVPRTGAYEFRVSAQNDVGEGPQSLPATIGVNIAKPAAPTNLTATANDDASVTLRWEPVTGPGSIRYRVYQRDVTSGQTDFAATTAVFNGASASVLDLLNGHTYEFRATAANSTGESPPSNPVQTTARLAPPPAPSNLTATANPDGTIGLSWTSSGPGIWYSVYSKDVTTDTDLTTGFSPSQYPVTNGTTHTAAYLQEGHRYAFYVTAIGKQDTQSARSNIAQATSRTAPPPAPTGLTATANPDGTIGLSWTMSAPGIWYWVCTKDITNDADLTSGFVRSQYPVTGGTIHTAAYLQNGHTYAFFVTAIGPGDQESDRSNVVQATSRIAPPPAPTDLTATANPDGTIALSWRSSGPDVWYWVYTRPVGGTFARSQYPVSNGTAHTAAFLNPGTTYEFRVTAIGVGDTESLPSNIAAATSYIPPPAAPTNLTATAGNTVVNLSWSSVGAGVWYWVYSRDVSAKEESFTRSQFPVTNGTTFTAAFLHNNDVYEFYVTAIGTGGTDSPRSNMVQAMTHMDPPPAPTSLTATPRNDGTIQLNWTSSGNGIWYWVYMKDVNGRGYTRSQYPVTNGPSFIAGYLSIGHRYSFYVTAFNDGGESPRSNIVEATATVPPPPAPTLSARSNADGTITLNWTSSGAGLWYYVYWHDLASDGGFTRMQYPVTTGTTTTAGYLLLNHTYQYKVTAINAGGEGPASNIVTAASVIPPPSGLTATYAGPTAVKLNWNAVNPGAMFWVYVRDTQNSSYQRQTYPVSGRTWQIVSPLKPGHTYQFLVTQAGNGGETGASNVASFLLVPPADGSCASVTSNYIGTGDPREGDFSREQLFDVTSTACGVRNADKVTLFGSWTTHNHTLLQGVFAYVVTDCDTGQTVFIQYLNYVRENNAPAPTEDARTFTVTVNPLHKYQVWLFGSGDIFIGFDFISSFSAYTLPPIIPFRAYSRCF